MPTTSRLSGIKMRVLCKNLGKGDLLEAEVAHGFLRTTEFHVTVGREYAVYGLLFTGGVLHYLIYEDNLIPLWHPTSMFAVVCDRVPRCWRIANWSDSERDFVVVSFPEITESPQAFDSLSNGDRKARAAFYERKQLAFPDPPSGKSLDCWKAIGSNALFAPTRGNQRTAMHWSGALPARKSQTIRDMMLAEDSTP